MPNAYGEEKSIQIISSHILRIRTHTPRYFLTSSQSNPAIISSVKLVEHNIRRIRVRSIIPFPILHLPLLEIKAHRPHSPVKAEQRKISSDQLLPPSPTTTPKKKERETHVSVILLQPAIPGHFPSSHIVTIKPHTSATPV